MLISIAATIVGGVGSLRGAAVAGLLLGMAENLSLAWIHPQWSEAVPFVVRFLFILFLPGGVLGRAMASSCPPGHGLSAASTHAGLPSKHCRALQRESHAGGYLDFIPLLSGRFRK